MTEQPSTDTDLMVKALAEIKRLRAKVTSLEQAQGDLDDPIAVVGMACRFPGNCNSPEAFWDLLTAGRDAIGDIPADRWDVDAYYDSGLFCVDKMYTKRGGFLFCLETFDAEAFGIHSREVPSMDPQQRLLLQVCKEALEDAGEDLPLSTGVFVGAMENDYFQRFVEDPMLMDSRTGTGNSGSVLAGRLSYHFGFQGPSFVIDTSCSSSLVALHQACGSLHSGECNMALAGGVSLMLHPVRTIALCRARMLSPDGRCKTFDAAADGYGRGEGCGLVVLKRKSDALDAGDTIHALICGTAVNHNGHSSGLTVPNVNAQQQVIAQALRNAGVQPEEVSYVEAHGTGTPLGDPLELEALNRIYRGEQSTEALHVGSVKTNIGHLEAAAGIASLMKVVQMLKHGKIPPHLNLQTPNPHIPWESMSLNIPREVMSWDVKQRVAAVSSFGFSGTNAHMILKTP